jgi:hypothetical protein
LCPEHISDYCFIQIGAFKNSRHRLFGSFINWHMRYVVQILKKILTTDNTCQFYPSRGMCINEHIYIAADEKLMYI